MKININVFHFILLLFTFVSSFSSPSYCKKLQRTDKYAAIVINGKTGEILHAHRADKLSYPASLTKMMTLYMVFKALDQRKLAMNEVVEVSKWASRQQPSKLGLRPGDRIYVRDVVCGLVTKSANDAAVAIAEHLADGDEEEFAEKMTKQAQLLGMRNTVFRNASGWHNAGQVTTARDMALLARALYNHFPHYFSYFAIRSFRFRGIKHMNHNKLLGKHGVNGIKTGFTNPAGFNLVASAVRGKNHVISVVMGGESGKWRDQRTATLLDEGFKMIHNRGAVAALTPAVAKEADQCAPRKLQVNSVFGQLENSKTFKALTKDKAHPALQQRAAVMEEDDKDWAIQLGTYKQKGAARKAANLVSAKAPKKLRAALKAAQVNIQKRGKAVYRVAFEGLSKLEAERACQALKQRHPACRAVTISHS